MQPASWILNPHSILASSGREVSGHSRAEGFMVSEAPVPSLTRATGLVQDLVVGASRTLICGSPFSSCAGGGVGWGGKSCGCSRPCLCPGALPVVPAQSSPHQSIHSTSALPRGRPHHCPWSLPWPCAHLYPALGHT